MGHSITFTSYISSRLSFGLPSATSARPLVIARILEIPDTMGNRLLWKTYGNDQSQHGIKYLRASLHKRRWSIRLLRVRRTELPPSIQTSIISCNIYGAGHLKATSFFSRPASFLCAIDNEAAYTILPTRLSIGCWPTAQSLDYREGCHLGACTSDPAMPWSYRSCPTSFTSVPSRPMVLLCWDGHHVVSFLKTYFFSTTHRTPAPMFLRTPEIAR